MHWDILFLDLLGTKYFDTDTLKKEAIGGAEASIVGVAEGLGSLGLKVAIVEANCAPFKIKKGKNCTFIHVNQLNSHTTCDHYVQIRNMKNPDLFPDAKKYVWMHDLGEPKLGKWQTALLKYNIKMIAVSKWHEESLKKFFPKTNNFAYTYNPIPEAVYLAPGSRPDYDKNIIIWMSSPHKGLGKAIELHKKIRARRPLIKIMVFNPGYIEADHEALRMAEGVYYIGVKSRTSLWNTVKEALCVFYPCQWDETFGCIAAEANALGTPLASYARGALPEVISSDTQLVRDGDEEGIIKRVIDWHDHGRPLIYGNDKFKIENVCQKWIKILNEGAMESGLPELKLKKSA